MTVDFQNVYMAYADKTVFSDLSCTLHLHGVTVLMGESGGGKTTLLRLLCGLETPQSGKINGIPKNYTFMFQENRLLPWATALENVKTVCDTESARHWLSAVGLAKEADSLPSALSGGMQRRVAFARALAHKSDILLLDEPFKGLDVGNDCAFAKTGRNASDFVCDARYTGSTGVRRRNFTVTENSCKSVSIQHVL